MLLMFAPDAEGFFEDVFRSVDSLPQSAAGEELTLDAELLAEGAMPSLATDLREPSLYPARVRAWYALSLAPTLEKDLLGNALVEG